MYLIIPSAQSVLLIPISPETVTSRPGDKISRVARIGSMWGIPEKWTFTFGYHSK